MNAEQSHPETALAPVRRALSSLAFRIYVAGIALVFFTVFATDALNPRGRRGVSWFDDLTLPLSCISLVVCIIAPFFAVRPLPQRIGLSLLGVAGFALGAVIALMVATMIFGFPDQE